MKPRKPKESADARELLSTALSECLDATSSLHMEPRPIPTEQQRPDNNGYLSDVDVWAQHAAEHVYSAVDHIRVAQRDIAIQRDKIWRALDRGLKQKATVSDVYEQLIRLIL
jgi:hypothetical protein